MVSKHKIKNNVKSFPIIFMISLLALLWRLN